jgi:hypothetical protein
LWLGNAARSFRHQPSRAVLLRNARLLCVFRRHEFETATRWPFQTSGFQAFGRLNGHTIAPQSEQRPEIMGNDARNENKGGWGE